MVSDVVDCSAVLEHPRSEIWTILNTPELLVRFFHHIGRCDRVTADAPDQPAVYSVHVGTAAVGIRVHQIQPVTVRAKSEMLIEAVDADGFASIRLADAKGGRSTRVTVTLFKIATLHRAVAAADNAAAISWVLDGLKRVEDYLSNRPTSVLTNNGDSRSLQLSVAMTMIRTGVVRTARPDRGVRQLNSLAKFGVTVAGGFAAAAAHSPKNPAITDDSTTHTFAEVHERSNRLASALETRGLDADSTVGVMSRNHYALVECLVACSKLGVTAVLFNTGLGTRQVEDIGSRHDWSALLVDDEFDPLIQYLPHDIPRISLQPASSIPDRISTAELIDSAGTKFDRPAEPGHIVVLTSGTSGTPKGARRPTPKGFGPIAAMLSRMPLQMNDRMLIAAPLFHSWGFAALQISTPIRAHVILQSRFDAEQCLAAIAQHRCTSLIAIPVMIQRMLDLPERVRRQYDTSSLRVVACSGSPMSATLVTDFMDAFGNVLYNFYGSTEVSWGTIADPADLRAAPMTAGRPPLGTTVAIVDSRGRAVPQGALGRIFVGNDMLFDGYIDASAPERADNMMDTGDLGYLDADGRLFVAGRDDEMIISGGENVFPRPVEEALSCLPQISEVAVIGVPDKEFGQRLAAFVVPRPGVRIDEDMVRSYVRHRLSRFAVPRDITFVDELPRNATGKVLKRQLPGAR
ncbi:AMP-binding protein [Skermania sp. ID1734]|uniref:AMP-binding protein n=1 Tax=Skermania sp. ID1734 TaxID=2597516 RepID=UPI00117DCC86|nr:AMP-binding protein [Skermania sp. ID1734]TSE00752.1 AMP-binding protein [Skermania sp. ID1734]